MYRSISRILYISALFLSSLQLTIDSVFAQANGPGWVATAQLQRNFVENNLKKTTTNFTGWVAYGGFTAPFAVQLVCDGKLQIISVNPAVWNFPPYGYWWYFQATAERSCLPLNDRSRASYSFPFPPVTVYIGNPSGTYQSLPGQNDFQY